MCKNIICSLACIIKSRITEASELDNLVCNSTRSILSPLKIFCLPVMDVEITKKKPNNIMLND